MIRRQAGVSQGPARPQRGFEPSCGLLTEPRSFSKKRRHSSSSPKSKRREEKRHKKQSRSRPRKSRRHRHHHCPSRSPSSESRSSSCESRHRGRSPEEGRKSHRRHSRRCSKTLGKASPEARSSHPPTQPVQMLSLLSARGVVSIPHSLLSRFRLRFRGEVEEPVQGSVCHILIQTRANIPLVSDLIID
uniref:Serine/arginine repetitive matrix 4 n=1 Tax=Rousettus aegyptiacus TaxID=9407 RepID=A0A7J8H6U5_ROUAE|nr:serine/arginine repetitive matrix 4 [Rousettus aegyptiacus]